MHVWVQSRYRVFAEGLVLLLAKFGLDAAPERTRDAEVALIDLSLHQAPFPEPPDLPTLAIANGDDGVVLALLRRRYRGYVKPSDEPKTLVKALRAVRKGEIWAERRLLSNAVLMADGPKLTPKQNEILSYLAKGMSNKAIAETLGITEGTVKMHVTQVYSKLGVQSRAELLARVLGK